MINAQTVLAVSVWGSELTSVPTVTKKDDSIHLEACSVTSPERPSWKLVWEDHQELKNENGWWLEEPGLLMCSCQNQQNAGNHCKMLLLSLVDSIP